MNYTPFEIGCNVSPWIDIETGEFGRETTEFQQDLAGYAEDIIIKALDSPLVFVRGQLRPEVLNVKLSKSVFYEKTPSLKEVKKLLDDVIKDVPDKRLIVLKDMLSNIKGVKELRMNKEITRIIKEIGSDDARVRELLEKIERDRRALVLGKFEASDIPGQIGMITIYTKAIAISRRTEVSSFDTVFWATFAHEVFHAYHYSAFVQNGNADRWSDKSDESKIVKESLAAAFENGFLTACDLPDAKNLRRELAYEWLDSDLLDWPYSGALGIVNETMPDYEFKSVRRLIEHSLEGWKLPAEAIKAGYYKAKVHKAIGRL